MSHKPFEIDTSLVQRLLAMQFPEWKHLAISPIIPCGWDNRSFRLGDTMLIRMPSAEMYSHHVEKEHSWLPKLSPFLPLQIPTPLAMGKASKEYPWNWSIYTWIEGRHADSLVIDDMSDYAKRLARFLTSLQSIDTLGGPHPGKENFFRGGKLSIYDGEVRQALLDLQGKVDIEKVLYIWEKAVASCWQKKPVWVHGDISVGNMIIRKGQLAAIIDFGQLAIGDPACDLAIAWTFFNKEIREIFRKNLHVDKETWLRGKGWALWKALIVAAGYTNPSNTESAQCWRILNEIVRDADIS